jgi:hypothetical protein
MQLEFSLNVADPTRPYYGMNIETPSQLETAQSVDEFFEGHSENLAYLEHQGVKISSVKIELHEMEGLAPPSHFLDGLRSFLQRRAFTTDAEIPERQISVRVSDDVLERSDEIIEEAVAKICYACLRSEGFRSGQSRSISVPVTPPQKVVDRVLLTRKGNHSPGMVLGVDDSAGTALDVLELRVAGRRLLAVGAAHAAALTARVLGTTRAPCGGVVAILNSPRIAAAVAASLRSHPGHPYGGVVIIACGHSYSGGPPVTERPALDGTDLFPALLRCPSLSTLHFEEFRFSTAAFEAVQQAMATSAAAAVSSLAMQWCKTVDPSFGLVDLATAVSRSSTLQCLDLAGSPVTMRDMKSLCGLLTGSEWSIKKLTLGNIEAAGAHMDDDCVSYLFQHLPSMTTLQTLRLYYKVPEFVFRRIAEGIKNNYSLEEFDGLVFASDATSTVGTREEAELEAYVSANMRGRRTVHEAVADPENRGLQEAALAVLHRLANSDDAEDGSVLFMCLQLVLPARAKNLTLTPPSPPARG